MEGGPGSAELLIERLFVDLTEAFALLKPAPGGDPVIELVADELDLLALIVVLKEADEVAGQRRGSWRISSVRWAARWRAGLEAS